MHASFQSVSIEIESYTNFYIVPTIAITILYLSDNIKNIHVDKTLLQKKLLIVVVREVCPSVRPSVRPAIRPSVCRMWKFFFRGNLISNSPIDLKFGLNVR